MFINFKTKEIYITNPKTGSTFFRTKLHKIGFDGPYTSFKKICKDWDYKGDYTTWHGIWEYTSEKYKMHGCHSTMFQIVDLLEKNGHDSREFTYLVHTREPRTWLLSFFLFSKFSKDWTPFCFNLKQNALKDFSIPYHGDISYNGKYDGYTFSDYINTGYELTKNVCSSPLPLNELLVLNQGYNIKLYKSEFMKNCLYDLKSIYPNIDATFEIKNKGPEGKNLQTLTEEEENKIKELFHYEYENFYNEENSNSFVFNIT